MDDDYFIYFPETERKLSIIMCEYGDNARNINYEKLKEYGDSLGTVYLQ